MLRLKMLAAAMILASAGSIQASPWLAFGLPLVFGGPPVESTPLSPWAESLRAKTLSSPPLVDLSPKDFDEEQEFAPPKTRQVLANECLDCWRVLWKQGRYDHAARVAEKAAQLDPANVDAQHALIVSRLIQESAGHQTTTSFRNAPTVSVEIDIRPNVLSWFRKSSPTPTASATPVVHLTPALIANRVEIATPHWRGLCNQFTMQGSHAILSGDVRLEMTTGKMEIRAEQVIIDMATGNLQSK